MDVNYSNLNAFMKRNKITIKDLSEAVGKCYPTILNKLNTKQTSQGKTAVFNIIEAKQITDFLITKEKQSLQEKFGEDWFREWSKRWGHVTNWLNYLFFDETVTIVNDVSNF